MKHFSTTGLLISALILPAVNAAADGPPADIEVIAVDPPDTTARDTALGIGIAGLGAGTLAMGMTLEEADTGSIVFGLISLGVGFTGFATAGIIDLLDDRPSPPLFDVSLGPSAASALFRW